MRKSLVIILGKISSFLLKKLGRGSSMPGQIVLKLYKDILKDINYPDTVIAVTGTTGKSSVTSIIGDVISLTNKSYAHNLKGSNLTCGVTTTVIDNVDLKGNFKKDILLLEVDERYTKEVFKYFKPTHLVVTNISRDQPARNGHHDIVIDDILKELDENTHLILNTDDPLISKFSLNHKGELSYFGVNKTEHSTNTAVDLLDILYCPVCNSRLNFEYFNYGNLSNYNCPNCDFKRNEPDYAVTKVDYENNVITINETFEIKSNNIAMYNLYNLVSSFAVCNMINIDTQVITEGLSNSKAQNRRIDTLTFNDRNYTVLVSKNETNQSYNQSLLYVNNFKGEKTVVIGFNDISRRYKEIDLSWLYDISFESINDNTVDKVICVGPYSNNIALALKYSGFNKDKVITLNNLDNINETLEKTKGDVFGVLYFDMTKPFIDKISGGNK